MTFANVGSTTNMTTFLSGLAPLDIVSIYITSDTSNIYPVGLIFEYTNG